mmetsp:Transcript_1768/g.5259  ORF Transcript_1768/g.5259 Transcript_1768/m.5259 type:complete len:271 (+) Transcript_1768:127-939(+)
MRTVGPAADGAPGGVTTATLTRAGATVTVVAETAPATAAPAPLPLGARPALDPPCRGALIRDLSASGSPASMLCSSCAFTRSSTSSKLPPPCTSSPTRLHSTFQWFLHSKAGLDISRPTDAQSTSSASSQPRSYRCFASRSSSVAGHSGPVPSFLNARSVCHLRRSDSGWRRVGNCSARAFQGILPPSKGATSRFSALISSAVHSPATWSCRRRSFHLSRIVSRGRFRCFAITVQRLPCSATKECSIATSSSDQRPVLRVLRCNSLMPWR